MQACAACHRLGAVFVVRFIIGVIIQLLWWLWVWQG
jgi:hypothetical protein